MSRRERRNQGVCRTAATPTNCCAPGRAGTRSALRCASATRGWSCSRNQGSREMGFADTGRDVALELRHASGPSSPRRWIACGNRFARCTFRCTRTCAGSWARSMARRRPAKTRRFRRTCWETCGRRIGRTFIRWSRPRIPIRATISPRSCDREMSARWTWSITPRSFSCRSGLLRSRRRSGSGPCSPSRATVTLCATRAPGTSISWTTCA